MTVIEEWGLPDKDRYCIAELLPAVAAFFEINESAARQRIYRAICDGRLKARSHLGSMRIPRTEVENIFLGEEPSR